MDYLPDRIAVGHNLAVVRAATSPYATFTHHASSSYNTFTHHATNTYATFSHHATNAANKNGILATEAHFNSYFHNSASRKGAQHKTNHWKLPVIIVASVVGAILLAAIAFFLIKRRQRSAKYRNLEQPTLGEHKDVFDARITDALESDAHEQLATGARDADYQHPYMETDTSYRGPEKPFTEKSQDIGA